MTTELIPNDANAVCCEGGTCETTQTFVQPNVSIFETDQDLIVRAEMPGVDDRNVEVQFERKCLTMKGTILPVDPEGMKLAWREFHADGYQRTFVVHEDIDRDRIEATMKDGILTITLPKTVPAAATRIAVQSG